MHFELSRDKWIYLVRCSVQRRENRRRRSVLARFGYLIQRDIRHIRLIWAPQTICRVFNFPHTFLRALARRPILHAINYFAFKNSFSFLVLLLTHRTSTLTNPTSLLSSIECVIQPLSMLYPERYRWLLVHEIAAFVQCAWMTVALVGRCIWISDNELWKRIREEKLISKRQCDILSVLCSLLF